MSLKIKNLTVKNFLSVGNVTQAVDFDRSDLTLVLGENLDLGGDDSGARNGTGKTSIINALSYGMFGQALTNIKKDNLINKTNNKNMLVTVDFECDGVEYRIERGRRPSIFKFFVNDVEKENKDDNSQGDSRETQAEMEKLLGMSHDMFKHIVALNTYTEPFLSLKAADQRLIIEQLLGITLLSEKAESLKEQVRITKEMISQEEYKIKANQEANERIKEQLTNLKRRQHLWQMKHEEDITKLEKAVGNLAKLDIDSEISLHANWKTYNKAKDEIMNLEQSFNKLLVDEEKLTAKIEKNTREIKDLEQHKCYACGQKLHDNKQNDIIKRKKNELAEETNSLKTTKKNIARIEDQIKSYDGIVEPNKTFYDKEEEAFNHRTSLEHLSDQLKSKMMETDPYCEQIEEMQNKALVEISYDEMNSLNNLRDHQEFLLKLLTNKDSFIRKRIIDQNLNYLNTRLSYYLDKIGLPHTVTFLNDLNVDIQELGRDLDFDNLSRGERNRLILSLSWAFRDVWESLYKPINLLFIDELIDSGMDGSGVESSLAILKKMGRELNKSVWLISHKDELTTRVNHVLRVVKENGFTNYNTYIDVN